MSLFRVPATIIAELHRLIARFWWGGSEDNRKIHWKRWELLSKLKAEGGLGFKDLGDFNRALLGRLTWRILQHPDCLMARVLKAKYFPDSSVLDFEGKATSSYLCKSLCWGRDLVREGLRWQVGSGNIGAFSQPWIPRTGTLFAVTVAPDDQYPWRVADFISNGKWDHDLIRNLLIPYDAEAILRIPLGRATPDRPRQPPPSPSSLRGSRTTPAEDDTIDRMVWHLEEDGVYTVLSGYRLARSTTREGPSSSAPHDTRWWKTMWGLHVPPKVKHMIWRMWFNVLPTFGALRGRGIPCLPFCKFCGALPEDSLHAI